VQAEAVCEDGTARIGDGHDMLVNAAGRWGGTVTPSYLGTVRGRLRPTGPGLGGRHPARRGHRTRHLGGYAVAAVSEAGVRAQTEGVRTEVELVERPTLHR
jgi:myo-inositol 2-dehydrogenase/D-chiro-inositol 1-dehydrogenase